jgi:hypothetical protein
LDPNRKHAIRIAVGIWLASFSIVAGTMWLSIAKDYEPYLVVLTTMVAAIVAAVPTVVGFTFAFEPITSALPAGSDPQALSRMLGRLVSISRKGLPAGDRMAAQREIDAGSEQIEHLFGKEAWVVANELAANPVPDQMSIRSETIASSEMLGRLAARKHGTSPAYFKTLLAWILPTIVAVIRDFGLDPKGFAPSSRRLPGQDLGTPVSVPLLASRARALACEWLDGDNAGVPMLDRIEADKAATVELDSLESAWSQARSTTPEQNVDEVDASFQRGIDRLSAKLSETIALRSKADRDALETNVRYLDAKHAG